MYENQKLISIISSAFLIVLAMYLLVLFILRFVFKLKRNYNVERKAQKRLPKWFTYTYIILLIVTAIDSLFYNRDISYFLVVILINQIIVAKIALGLLEDRNQKYYQYSTITFGSIGVVFFILVGILKIV